MNNDAEVAALVSQDNERTNVGSNEVQAAIMASVQTPAADENERQRAVLQRYIKINIYRLNQHVFQTTLKLRVNLNLLYLVLKETSVTQLRPDLSQN